jgi:adenylate cyclase
VPGLPIYSAGLRFLQRLGFSLLQALLFGGLLGLLVYSRAPRMPEEEGTLRALLTRPFAWLESWERFTYDWRARALGARSTRSEDVVVVALDDETLAEARQDTHRDIASNPWPREIFGGLSGRMLEEGAGLVLLDFPFTERSPRACPIEGTPGVEGLQDDQAFRKRLDEHPGGSVLAFSWALDRVLPPGSRLWPYRVRLGAYPNAAEAQGRVQAVLADQRPAFVIPAGSAVEVWAGVTHEQEGSQVAQALGVREPRVEERQATDDVFRVGAIELFVSLAEVQVEGVEPSQLTEVRQLQHPVAPLLGAASRYGAVTLLPDPDGVVRAIPHLVSYRSRDRRWHVLPSMPLAAAMRLAGTRTLRYADGRLHVGSFSVPMDASGYSLLRWDAAEVGRGSRGSVARAIPAWSVLGNLLAVREGVLPRVLHELKGRAVVFTDTSRQAQGFQPTPIGEWTPGGAILAQALVNLLQSQGISRAEPRTDLLLTFGLAIVGAFLALTFTGGFRSFWGTVLFLGSLVAAGAAYAWGAWYLFAERQQWVAVAGPLLAMVLTSLFTNVQASRTEQQLRHFVTGVLGRYVSPEVLRFVTRDLRVLTRPERRTVTVSFCDIEGFTRLSEQLPPERLVQLLNDYLTEMTAVVRSTRGHVDKYLGDAVLAFWGAPVATERHAHQACEAALKMKAALQERQAHWERVYGHRLQFRVGIASGEVLVGGVGSDLESKYTVMGEAVKHAMLHEGANRTYGTSVLVGDATARAAQDAFVFREVDRVRLKGRAEPTRMHELMGRKGEIAPLVQEQLTLYEQALTAYHQRRFDEALALFEQGLDRYGDPVAGVYVARCRGYVSAAPPEDWDGVYALEAQ